MKKSNLLILCSFLIIGLVSCNNSQETEVNSIYECFEKLKTAKNYSVTTDVISSTETNTFTIKFTENGYLCDDPFYSFGYVKDDNGIYYYDFYHNKFTPSAYLKNENGVNETNLWNEKLFTSFASFDLKDFSAATGKEYDLKSKNGRLSYISLVNGESILYTYTTGAKITVGNTINSMVIEYKFSTGHTFKTKIHNFGTTKIKEIEDYKKSGGSAYKLNSEQQRMQDLFSTFNYKRETYDLNDNKTVIGWEWYNKDYFYGDYTDEYMSSNLGLVYEQGVIGVKNKSFDGIPLNGTYYFYIQGNQVSLITTAPMNRNPDVTKVVNYPTYMQLFNNMQYMIPTNNANEYTCDDELILDDFATNFQLKASLDEIGAKPEKLDIKIELKEENKDCRITFDFFFRYGNSSYNMTFPFIDFGEANIPHAEYLLSQFK